MKSKHASTLEENLRFIFFFFCCCDPFNWLSVGRWSLNWRERKKKGGKKNPVSQGYVCAFLIIFFFFSSCYTGNHGEAETGSMMRHKPGIWKMKVAWVCFFFFFRTFSPLNRTHHHFLNFCYWISATYISVEGWCRINFHSFWLSFFFDSSQLISIRTQIDLILFLEF